VDAAPFTHSQVQAVRHGLLIAFIVLFGWVVLTAVDIASALYLRRHRMEAPDNLLARKHQTQVRIFQRAATIVVVTVTAAMALMTVPGVRQIGVSLLAALASWLFSYGAHKKPASQPAPPSAYRA